MKKLLLLLFLPLFIFSSCLKTNNTPPFDSAKQAIIDDTTIQTYLQSHPDIHAVKDSSGVYYQIVTQGTGEAPILTSTITVAYTGTLINGTQFDSSPSLKYPLNGLIPGWQIVLPYLKSGGRMFMLIPSRYAYGNQQSGSIPANSVLLFTIDLTTVSNGNS